MKTITLEDLKKMTIVELKAFVYDQMATKENADMAIKVANEIIQEKLKNQPVQAENKEEK